MLSSGLGWKKPLGAEMAPRRPDHRDQLIAMMKKHGLTQERVAEITLRAPDTIRKYCLRAGTKAHKPVPLNVITLLEAQIKLEHYEKLFPTLAKRSRQVE